MPKVSNVRVVIDEEVKILDIHYNKKESFHIKDFPIDVISILDIRQTTFYNHSTERELTNAVYETINRYHEVSKTSRKVITYTLFASTEIRMQRSGVNRGSWTGTRKGISEGVRGGGGDHESDYQIGFDYEVLLETNKNGKTYNVINTDGSIGYSRNIDRYAVVIDWTEERQKAFEMLADGMYKLMVKICSALGDEKKAIAFIDSKIKLLQ